MTATVSREVEPFAAQLENLRRQEEVSPRTPLSARRQIAFDRFAALGFPTTRDEEWKYTSVAPIARATFRLATPEDGRSLTPDTPLPLGDVTRCRLVFINGVFAPRLSVVEGLPDGVVVGSLSAMAQEAEAVERHLARYARWDDRAFVALNTALMTDGAFLYLPRGAVVEEPIHFLFLSIARAEPLVTYPRALIVAEETSQATIVESYVGEPGAVYFTNAVTEIVLAEGAVLDHYRVQRESAAAFHIATQQVYQSRSSTFTTHSVQLGGGLVRNDINAVLDGPGGECTLNGLYVVDGHRHVDNHTAIDHAQPHCNSHELYKGILDGHGTAVFNGKIYVRQGAQKTDAKQTNQNLLLSEDATINTKPQLEIFADDVRCTHGATVGQLDRDALFYLRSRGIGVEAARALLTHAFATDILSRVKVEPLRRELETLLEEFWR